VHPFCEVRTEFLSAYKMYVK